MRILKLVANCLAALILCACGLLAPAPNNEQIEAAISAFNTAQGETLEWVYGDMEVPHRSSGRAHAVIWVEDKSIQRNVVIAYDKGARCFYVESFSTLQLGEDGSYRQVQP